MVHVPGVFGRKRAPLENRSCRVCLLNSHVPTEKLIVRSTLLTFDVFAGVWSTVLYGKSLYVHIPTSTNGEGSKDSFIRLLEFAEEHLRCSNVVVFFQQERPDAGKFDRFLA